MDGNGSLFGTLCGNNREILHKVRRWLAHCWGCTKYVVGKLGAWLKHSEILHKVRRWLGWGACAAAVLGVNACGSKHAEL